MLTHVASILSVRWLVYVGSQLVAVALWLTEWTARRCADLFVGVLRVCGPCEVVRDGQITFNSCGQYFWVEHWCTPTWIFVGASLLLFASGGAPKKFLAWPLAIAFGAAVASAGNTIVSVWVLNYYPETPWNLLHVPGTAVIYIACFVLCLCVCHGDVRRT